MFLIESMETSKMTVSSKPLRAGSNVELYIFSIWYKESSSSESVTIQLSKSASVCNAYIRDIYLKFSIFYLQDYYDDFMLAHLDFRMDFLCSDLR